jgi:hypothetical protein
VHAVAYDASGNLIVATNTNLFKLSSTGATTWSRPLAVLGVATGPADTIYVVTGTDVMKLDAAGNDVWSRSHALGGCALGEGFQHNVAVGSDGAVAIRGAAGIGRWDTDGTPSWTKSMTAFDRCSVAIDAGGVVLANVEGADPDNTDVDRYAADGTALAPVGPFAGYHGMITTDSSGALVHTQSGHSDVHLGAPNATASFETVSAAYVSAGAAAAGADVGWVYWQDTDDISEWRARRYNAAGVQTWFMSRPALACDVGIACNAMPYSISGAATGRIAVGGHYDGLGPKTAWVQVYDP